jgi:hypothetical protein
VCSSDLSKKQSLIIQDKKHPHQKQRRCFLEIK